MRNAFRNVCAWGLILALLGLSSAVAWAQPATVGKSGSDWTVHGNGADLSEVCRKFFRGQNVTFYPNTLSIKVEQSFTGSRNEVKAWLEDTFDIEIYGLGHFVAIRKKGALGSAGGTGYFLGETGGKWELLVSSHTMKEILRSMETLSRGSIEIEALSGVDGIVARGVSIRAASLEQLLTLLAKKVPGLEIQKVGDVYVASKVDSKPRGRVWKLRNVGHSNISGTLADGVSLEVSKEAADVAKIINTLLGTTEKGKETATAVGNQIVLKGGSKEDLDQAEFLLATNLDIPASQVQLDVWAVQMSTELRSTRSFNQRMGRIHEGYQLVRYLLGRTSRHSSEFLRSVGVSGADFLREVGFDPGLDRPLSPADLLVLMAFVNRDKSYYKKYNDYVVAQLRRDLIPIRERLTAQKGERSERLLELLEDLESNLLSGGFEQTAQAYGLGATRDYSQSAGQAQMASQQTNDPESIVIPDLGVQRPSGGNALTSLRKFVAAYLDWANPDWRSTPGFFGGGLPEPSLSPRDIVRHELEGDILLRSGVKAISADLDRTFYTPFLKWVHEELKCVTETSVVARSSIVVDSTHMGQLGASAVSYHPLTPIEEKEQTELFEVLRADPRVNLLDVLLRPKPNPVFTHLSPGVSMAVIPSVSNFGDQAHLSFALSMTVEANSPDSLQEKGIKPADMVKNATLRTDTTVVGYDFLELSTVGLTDSRIGDPWGIPLLQDIPVVGPILFRYRGRPVRKHKEVLMFVQATIIPRSMDLIR